MPTTPLGATGEADDQQSPSRRFGYRATVDDSTADGQRRRWRSAGEADLASAEERARGVGEHPAATGDQEVLDVVDDADQAHIRQQFGMGAAERVATDETKGKQPVMIRRARRTNRDGRAGIEAMTLASSEASKVRAASRETGRSYRLLQSERRNGRPSPPAELCWRKYC